jgi:uncharacterized membrane protein
MTPPLGPEFSARPKSTFVTVVAWVFIILSGFATVISLLQNLMVGYMPRDLFDSAMQDSTFAHVMPPPARFMFNHLQLLVLCVFILTALMLAASIGLLQRRNWARRVFIGLLGFGIVYNLAGLVIEQSMMSSMTSQFPLDSAFSADSTFRSTAQRFDQMMAGFRIVMYVVTIGFAALFGWIIANLLSRPIREEFGVT